MRAQQSSLMSGKHQMMPMGNHLGGGKRHPMSQQKSMQSGLIGGMKDGMMKPMGNGMHMQDDMMKPMGSGMHMQQDMMKPMGNGMQQPVAPTPTQPQQAPPMGGGMGDM